MAAPSGTPVDLVIEPLLGAAAAPHLVLCRYKSNGLSAVQYLDCVAGIYAWVIRILSSSQLSRADEMGRKMYQSLIGQKRKTLRNGVYICVYVSYVPHQRNCLLPYRNVHCIWNGLCCFPTVTEMIYWYRVMQDIGKALRTRSRGWWHPRQLWYKRDSILSQLQLWRTLLPVSIREVSKIRQENIEIYIFIESLPWSSCMTKVEIILLSVWHYSAATFHKKSKFSDIYFLRHFDISYIVEQVLSNGLVATTFDFCHSV
jgi:hypothetical protein